MKRVIEYLILRNTTVSLVLSESLAKNVFVKCVIIFQIIFLLNYGKYSVKHI